MCIRVQYACVHSGCTPYDADEKVITVPQCMSHADRLLVVRAVLAELAVPQPLNGARCFCGEPVSASPRIPQQIRRMVTHGA